MKETPQEKKIKKMNWFEFFNILFCSLGVAIFWYLGFETLFIFITAFFVQSCSLQVSKIYWYLRNNHA